MGIRTKIVTGAAVVALAGGVGVGVAVADPTTSPTPTPGAPTATPSQGGERKADAGKHRSLLRRALHGEVTVGAKDPRVIVFQRGVVQKVSATSLTVRSADGHEATYAVDEQTRIRQNRQPASIADVKADEPVRVVADKDGSTLTARVIGNPSR